MRCRQAHPRALGLSILTVFMLAGGCRETPEPDASSDRVDSAAAIFTEETARVGLDFVHFNGMTGERYFVEVVGPGAALVDYDGDGDLDLYLRQGGPLGSGLPESTLSPTDRLYRNDATDGGGFKLVDVTERSGVGTPAYGMGVAAGDLDNNGSPDLYLTNFGANRLLINQGDGSFTDATAAAGVGDELWGVSASIGDLDRDGSLDLYAGNYVDFTVARNKRCYAQNSGLDYCGPLSYSPEIGRLFMNRGDGTFDDATASSGLASVRSRGLGALIADLSGDGWPDLYVANDGEENQLWINHGDGTFANEAPLRGCAVNGIGVREASMGVDGGDPDGDGDQDLVITHLASETNTIYTNQGEGMFVDSTLAAGLARPSRGYTGFGVSLLDFDNDGWEDLLVVNGEVRVIPELEAAGDPFPLHQTNQLYRNRGDGGFDEVTDRAGAAFELSEVSRGAAFGDIDNDGDTDVVIMNNNAPARLLLNQVGSRSGWLGLRLIGGGGRDMLGARAELFRPNQPARVRWSRTDGSYASARDPRIVVGLGGGESAERVRIFWPGGRVHELRSLPANRYLTLVEDHAELE